MENNWILLPPQNRRLTMKCKKVTFMFLDHWSTSTFMVERRLNIAVDHSKKDKDYFYAHQCDVDGIIGEIKTNNALIKKFNLDPDEYGLDISLHTILMPWKDSIVKVEPVEERRAA